MQLQFSKLFNISNFTSMYSGQIQSFLSRTTSAEFEVKTDLLYTNDSYKNSTLPYTKAMNIISRKLVSR